MFSEHSKHPIYEIFFIGFMNVKGKFIFP